MSAFSLEGPSNEALWMAEVLFGRIDHHFSAERNIHEVHGSDASELVFLAGMVVKLCKVANDETLAAITAEFAERKASYKEAAE